MGEIAEEMDELELSLAYFESALRLDSGYEQAVESLRRVKEIIDSRS